MMESTTESTAALTGRLASRRLTHLLILVSALVGLQVWQVYLAVKAPSLQQFEYLRESPPDELFGQCVSNMGVMGWEVITTRRVTIPSGRLLIPPSEVTEIIAKRRTGQAGVMKPPPDLGCRRTN